MVTSIKDKANGILANLFHAGNIPPIGERMANLFGKMIPYLMSVMPSLTTRLMMRDD
jgi:hypothetical protein